MRVRAIGGGDHLLDAHLPLLEGHGVAVVGGDAEVALGAGWSAAEAVARAGAAHRVLWVDGAPPRGTAVAPGTLVVATGRALAAALGTPGAPVVRPGRDPAITLAAEPPVPLVAGPLIATVDGGVPRELRRLGPAVDVRAPGSGSHHVAIEPRSPGAAFAAGAAVVGRRSWRLAEHVGDGHDGVLVGAGRGEVAGALAALAADPVRLHTLRHNAWRSAVAWPSARQQAGVLALALRGFVAGRVAAVDIELPAASRLPWRRG